MTKHNLQNGGYCIVGSFIFLIIAPYKLGPSIIDQSIYGVEMLDEFIKLHPHAKKYNFDHLNAILKRCILAKYKKVQSIQDSLKKLL